MFCQKAKFLQVHKSYYMKKKGRTAQKRGKNHMITLYYWVACLRAASNTSNYAKP